MKFEQKISLIIPAYNEAKNIHRVLDVVADLDFIDEKIVVNDCSIDKTVDVVKKYPKIRLINRKKNGGKGMALYDGIVNSKHDLLLFLDSDLIGLTESHILELLAPVAFSKIADLSLGVFDLKHLTASKLVNRTIPSISGQRVIWRKDLPQSSKYKDSHYGVDAQITAAVSKDRREVVVLHGLSQVMKEQKERDIWKAFGQRYKMYEDIFKTVRDIERGKKELKEKLK